MAYRGEDLDLRTPQTWTGTPAELVTPAEIQAAQNGKRGVYRSGPILVDETVLACCNLAYDVAVAHRAGEVRIEHLLNAMTRIDASIASLEARGIRVPSLRRETAAIVAGDIPPAGGNGSVSPRRSDEFADLLRLAAAAASRRNAAADVDDLLQILLDHRSDLPGSDIVLRFAARAPLRDVSEPLPPLTRSNADLRYTASSSGRYVSDQTRSYRGEITGSPTDALQNSRIEALEQIVRALSQDFSNERHIISGLVRDLGRDAQAHQGDQDHRQDVLLDRIGTLEQSVLEARGAPAPSDQSLVAKLEDIEAGLELRLQEMSQSWSVLSQRLQDLEGSIRERASASGATVEDLRNAVDLKPISSRLDIIEEALLGDQRRGDGNGELGERFDKLHGDVRQALATTNDGGRIATLVAGLEHINGLASKLDEQHHLVSQVTANLAERVGGVERALTGEIETAAAKYQAYANDLSELHDALMKLNQNQHTLAGSMDQWRTDAATDVANILNRIAEVDRDSALPVETLNQINAHMDTMNRFVVARYQRRHGFWYWLFGTDDWMGASWPSKKDSDTQA
ncbi:MAG: Clp protease [Hyphomicrobium sp.]|uniref:Clp protease n=1 Tax=Hyphomicrobium sp. TaxID=82 RepID=UPI00356A3D8B